MNYLIVMPRFVDKVGEWYFFPLGIPYISASMKKNGFNVFTLNLNNTEGDIKEIIKENIARNKIDVVLTGGLSVQYEAIKALISAVKEIDLHIITIVGGGIITSTPEVGMKALREVDYGIIGEGEITTCELCHALENEKDINGVDGVIYKDELSFKYNITKKRIEIEDLDTIPFPDYDGFDFAKTLELVPSVSAVNEKNTIVMLGSRSCPFQCTFCFHSSGTKYRQRSINNFFTELKFLKQKYDIKHIFIADELFSFNKERVAEFCKLIKPLNIKWYAAFRVSDITKELIEIAKEGNCTTIAFGLESADNRILKSMRKHITIEQIEQALKIVYESGIAIQGNFIFGDIEETLETAKNTLQWWENHLQYAIILNFIVTYPGTYLYDYAVKHKIIKDEVQFIKEGCPAINVSKMSQQEIAWLSDKIMKLPLKLMKAPDNLCNEVVDAVHSTISFSGECVHCKENNNWKDIRLFLRNQLSCSACGGKHKVPILEAVKNIIRENIEFILKKYNKIALWALPDYFVELIESIDIMESEKIYFIDNSALKQGGMLRNKIINSSDILEKESIEFVIVGAVGYFSMIDDQIRSKYANIKCVNILELIHVMKNDI